LRWKGSEDARGSIVRRYFGGRLEDVLGGRSDENVQNLEGKADAQNTVDAGGRGRVRPEDVERHPSVTGADSASSRARAIAEQLSGLSDLALENLGLTAEDRANIETLTGRRIALEQDGATLTGQLETAAFPTNDVVADLLGVSPKMTERLRLRRTQGCSLNGIAAAVGVQ
jgi:hypothetical protein